jgi:small-conductance mechanosensitive channel
MQGGSSVEEPDKPSAVFDRFQLWKEYEGVAMHFNDLIIRLRSQSLGGVAAVAALAAVVAKSDTTAELRWGLLTGAFALLSLFWVAVWALDLGYYNRLLAGAVDALLAIEKESNGSRLVDRIELSTKIEARVKSGGVSNNAYRITFYVVVFLALLGGLAVSACNLRSAGTG